MADDASSDQTAAEEDSSKGKAPHPHHCARKILEESIAMPFFRDSKDHLPAVLNLHAGIVDEGDRYELTTEIPCLADDAVTVTAAENSLDVLLTHDEDEPQGVDEHDHFDDPSFHSSYYLPDAIDPNSLTYSFVRGTLKASAKKKQ